MKKKIMCMLLCPVLIFSGLINAHAADTIIICADSEILPHDNAESIILSGVEGTDSAEDLQMCARFYFLMITYHSPEAPSLLSSFPGIILSGDSAEQAYKSIEEGGVFPDCLDVYIKDEFVNSAFSPGDFGESVYKIIRHKDGQKIFYRLILKEPDIIKTLHLKEKINALPFTEKTELIKEFSGGIFLTEPFIYFDADSDGIVSSGDARIILRISVKLQQGNFRTKYICDINKDGKLTADEARQALRTSVGIEAQKKGFFPV